jgi:hypothetical protein
MALAAESSWIPRAQMISRNKDGKNVPDATTTFKTAACLNVTLAYAGE